MRLYLVLSSVVFGLIVAAHVARILFESRALATDPGFVVITLAAAGLAIWSGRLAWRSRRAA